MSSVHAVYHIFPWFLTQSCWNVLQLLHAFIFLLHLRFPSTVARMQSLQYANSLRTLIILVIDIGKKLKMNKQGLWVNCQCILQTVQGPRVWNWQKIWKCTNMPCVLINRGSYTWKWSFDMKFMKNKPLASFLNFILNDHKYRILFFIWLF